MTSLPVVGMFRRISFPAYDVIIDRPTAVIATGIDAD